MLTCAPPAVTRSIDFGGRRYATLLAFRAGHGQHLSSTSAQEGTRLRFGARPLDIEAASACRVTADAIALPRRLRETRGRSTPCVAFDISPG